MFFLQILETLKYVLASCKLDSNTITISNWLKTGLRKENSPLLLWISNLDFDRLVQQNTLVYISSSVAVSEKFLSFKKILLKEPSSRHHVQIFELKGAWTPTNRNIAFSLHDGYSKAQTLKKNLSSDALKGFKVDSTQTPAVSWKLNLE